jgi:hypothetical protein
MTYRRLFLIDRVYNNELASAAKGFTFYFSLPMALSLETWEFSKTVPNAAVALSSTTQPASLGAHYKLSEDFDLWEAYAARCLTCLYL